MNTAIIEATGHAVPELYRIDDPTRDTKIGIAIAIFFFIFLLGAAAIVPLDAGVHASGSIAVSGNRQSVQHREGGTVTAIHVREGEKVRAGQLLVEMAAPDVVAAERAFTSDYLTLLAQRARLLAETQGRGDFPVPAEFANLSSADLSLAEQAMRLQRSLLKAKGGAISGQKMVLNQRSRQFGAQQSGYTQQQSSLQQQQKILEVELVGLRELEKKGFASGSRIRAMERSLEELRGREAAMVAEAARAAEGIGEARMESISISRTNLADVTAELRDTQVKISDVLPKLMAVREQLQRARVRAPASGQVVGLTVHTVGGVVAPGQTMMDIVPDNRMLVVQARVDPRGADDLFPGQEAQVRFSSVEDRSLPLLHGRVRTVSADSFTDEKSGQSFFRAEVEVASSELDKVRGVLGHGQLRPGLPVEVVMAVRKRTALQYILEPLTAQFWRSLREQ